MNRDAPIAIVHQTDRIVVVEKPALWLSVPSRMGEDDERPCLGRRLERQLGARLWPVHRLDYEVSGLVMFALDGATHRLLNGAFEAHQIEKTYEAILVARPDAYTSKVISPCTWTSQLLRGKKRAYEHALGKESITHGVLVDAKSQTKNGSTTRFEYWKLNPQTGRPHQLRYECAKHRGPIVGDALYGSKMEYVGGGIALRAVKIAVADNSPDKVREVVGEINSEMTMKDVFEKICRDK